MIRQPPRATLTYTLLPYTTLFRPVRKMDVPIVFLLGRHDYTVPSPVAADWFAQVEAPSKKLVWLEHSAHLPMVEEPGHFFAALLRDVQSGGASCRERVCQDVYVSVVAVAFKQKKKRQQ